MAYRIIRKDAAVPVPITLHRLIIGDQAKTQNDFGVWKHHVDKLPGGAAVISTGSLFTDEFGAFMVVQHGQELATCGEASGIHQRKYLSVKMWLCRLLQAEVWMFHHTEFPICQPLHTVVRDSLGPGVEFEKIEFPTIAEQL